MTPTPAKLGMPLTTLIEEQNVRETKPLLRKESNEVSNHGYWGIGWTIPRSSLKLKYYDLIDSEELQEWMPMM